MILVRQTPPTPALEVVPVGATEAGRAAQVTIRHTIAQHGPTANQRCSAILASTTVNGPDALTVWIPRNPSPHAGTIWLTGSSVYPSVFIRTIRLKTIPEP